MIYQGFYEISELVIEKLREAGCEVVTIGTRTGYSRNKLNVTPGAHIAPVGVNKISSQNTGTSTSVVTMEIFIYDQVTATKAIFEDLEEYGEENQVDTLDTCLRILDRFVAAMSKSFHLSNGSYIKIQNNTNFAATLDSGTDDVSGWLGTVSFTYVPGPSC